MHDIIAEMRARARRVSTTGVLIGEIYLPVERLVAYYGARRCEGVHLPFNFQLIAAPWKRADDRRS